MPLGFRWWLTQSLPLHDTAEGRGRPSVEGVGTWQVVHRGVAQEGLEADGATSLRRRRGWGWEVPRHGARPSPGEGATCLWLHQEGGAHHLTSAVEVVRAILCLELRDAQLVYIMSRQPRGGEQHQAQNKGSRDQGIKRSRSKLSSAISGSCPPPPLLDCPLDLLLFWYYFWGLLWLHFRQETRKHGDI